MAHRIGAGLFCFIALVSWAAASPAADSSNMPPTPSTSPAEVVRLWSGDAPGALGTNSTGHLNDIPSLDVFLPANLDRPAAGLLICPGGGYEHLAPHEGAPVARWFNSLGGAAFVLTYRLGPRYHYPAMFDDVSRAMRLIRARAAEWHVDPARLGVCGFSAGGHLASTLETHFDDGNAHATDPIDRQSSRPDFAILVYPVITMNAPNTHGATRRNLLGENPSPQLLDLLSNNEHVTAQTPPTYLVASTDDHLVPVQNTLMFAAALARHHVPFAMRLFDHGGHGYGLAPSDPELSTWPASCAQWLAHRGIIRSP